MVPVVMGNWLAARRIGRTRPTSHWRGASNVTLAGRVQRQVHRSARDCPASPRRSTHTPTLIHTCVDMFICVPCMYLDHALPPSLPGIWIMFVSAGWLQMYMSYGFGRLEAQEDFEDRLSQGGGGSRFPHG